MRSKRSNVTRAFSIYVDGSICHWQIFSGRKRNEKRIDYFDGFEMFHVAKIFSNLSHNKDCTMKRQNKNLYLKQFNADTLKSSMLFSINKITFKW